MRRWLAVLAAAMAIGGMGVAQQGQDGHLRRFLICYRWLLPAQAEEETSWWAAHYDFFVCGSTDQHRELLRRKSSQPMIRYTNVNNITRAEGNGQRAGHPDWEAMGRWLEAQRLPRERMFLHFAQDTVCRPVNMPAGEDGSTEERFEQVLVTGPEGETDVTGQAWSGRPPFSLPAGRQVLVVGSDERFDVVRIRLLPESDWQPEWEYRSAAGWKPLAVVERGNGEIAFTPPRDWQRESQSRLWQVRAKPAGGGLAAARTVRGRDCITWTREGYRFPGWEPEADRDGDGYVAPGECRPGASARFEYEARVPAFWVGRYLLNVAEPQVQRWNEALARLLLARLQPPYDGIFVDNGWYELPLDSLKQGGRIREPADPATWQQGTIANLEAVRRAVGKGLVILNTGNYTNPVYERYLEHCDGWLGETWIRPSREFPERNLSLVQERDGKGKIGLVHARLDPVGGDAERGKLLALALYYLCQGERTYLFVGDNYGAKPYAEQNWFGALEVDLGRPRGPARRLGTKAPVYQREFTRGLVLARPLPRYDANLTDGEPVPLPAGSYRKLGADGRPGEAVSGSLVLRNAEAAILVECR